MSATAPLVGIPLRPQRIEGHVPRQIVNRAYLDSLQAAGGIPLLLPLLDDAAQLRRLFDHCDALLLPGGADIDPRRYGQEADSSCAVNADPELDAHELLITGWALDAGLPLLAICRGAQLLNVARGGTLWQDIAAQRAGDAAHDNHGPGVSRAELVHELEVVAGTRLHGIVGGGRLRVNSLHHQAIRDLGDGLIASAHAVPDGLVEAVELPGTAMVLGIQCHPEELTEGHDWARRLFAALVAAAGR